MGRAPILMSLACALLLAACTPRFDWREIKAGDAGFAILLPDKPRTETREIAFEGGTIRMTIVSTGVGPTLFAAGVAQLPPESVATARLDSTVAWFRDALVRNIDGRITATQPIALAPTAAAGHLVRAGEVVEARGRAGKDGRPARLAARFHVVDDRLYQLVAIGAEGELTPDALETFFTSFRLIK
jgi:hypothetical protein